MRHHVGTLLVSVMLTAGVVSAAPMALVASTPRADYFSEGGARVDVERSERFLAGLEQRLGVPVPRSRVVRHRDARHLVAATGFYAAGVTLPEQHEMHSTLPFHPHELVHVAASGLGDPGVVFQEGLAVILGDDAKVEGRRIEALLDREPPPYRDVEARFRQGQAGPDDYSRAALFVRFLQQERGDDRLLRLFRECPGASAGPRVFQRVFGTTIEHAWAAAQRARPRR